MANRAWTVQSAKKSRLRWTMLFLGERSWNQQHHTDSGHKARDLSARACACFWACDVSTQNSRPCRIHHFGRRLPANYYGHILLPMLGIYASSCLFLFFTDVFPLAGTKAAEQEKYPAIGLRCGDARVVVLRGQRLDEVARVSRGVELYRPAGHGGWQVACSLCFCLAVTPPRQTLALRRMGSPR